MPKKMADEEKRGERVPLLLTRDELKKLDDWRFANRMPNRVAAVREMMRRVYEASETSPPSSMSSAG